MTTITTLFQQVSMLVFAGCFVLAMFGWWRHPRWWGAFFPVVLFAGYGIVYYALLLGGRLSVDEVFLWGASHRFLSGVIVLGGTAALLWALGGKHDGR